MFYILTVGEYSDFWIAALCTGPDDVDVDACISAYRAVSPERQAAWHENAIAAYLRSEGVTEEEMGTRLAEAEGVDLDEPRWVVPRALSIRHFVNKSPAFISWKNVWRKANPNPYDVVLRGYGLQEIEYKEVYLSTYDLTVG